MSQLLVTRPASEETRPVEVEEGLVCRLDQGQSQRQRRRGLLWVIGAFAICPCHLPFTLGLLATLLGGTAVGAFFQQNPLLAGAIISVVWAGGTWRGLRYLRQARNCMTCEAARTNQTQSEFSGLPR